MQRLAKIGLIIIEVTILSALILSTRCANYQDVFIGGNIYFTDADCYARMTRVRMCAEHPGLIIRHHQFENYPAGTTPHTTAPFDYVTVSLSMLLRAARLAVAPDQIDLAGALISPVMGLLGGWFLWWWSRRMKLRYRWMMLILYAISPILVHGAELGRPDHQSLSILLIAIGICADWTLAKELSKRWSAVSGLAWGLAIWVSAYEAVILFLLIFVIQFCQQRYLLFAEIRRIGWMFFGAILGIALLIEQRIPSFAILMSDPSFRNWARTVGEMAHISPADPIWLHWTGYLLLIAPLGIWWMFRPRPIGAHSGQAVPIFVFGLLITGYFLAMWQARWAYFFVLILAIGLPAMLEAIESRVAVWLAFTLSILPILRDWDQRLWPNDVEIARRVEQRNDSVELRDLATVLISPKTQPFLAPWWLSPAIAYWSGQPGVAGSSHESLPGILDTARFCMANNLESAGKILETHGVEWVFAYDSERVTQNSRAILGADHAGNGLCSVLDRTAGQAPGFLVLSGQNGVGKLYRVVNKL